MLEPPEELQQYFRYIEDVALPELAYHPFTVKHMPVLTKRAERLNTDPEVKPEEKLEWLRRFLYYTMFHTNSHDEVKDFFSGVGIWNPEL